MAPDTNRPSARRKFLERVVKLWRMLGSSHPGERTTALNKLTELLAKTMSVGTIFTSFWKSMRRERGALHQPPPAIHRSPILAYLICCTLHSRNIFICAVPTSLSQ